MNIKIQIKNFSKNIGKETTLKLTGSVYCLRNAPRTWYQRVKKDLEALGWRIHQLDQCVFLKYDGEELVGICGVYVDDFIIAGKHNNKNGKLMSKQLGVPVEMKESRLGFP